MKPISLVLSLLCLGTFLYAQDLHIYYDMQTQTPHYLIDSQEVKKPYVHKGSNVILHIENYNNYLYNVVIKQESNEIHLPSSVSPNSLTQLFPTLGQNAANFLSLIGGNRGANQIFQGFDKDDKEHGPRSFENALGLSSKDAERLDQLMTDYTSNIQKIQQLDTAITEKQKEVQSIIEGHQINAFVMEEIEAIKHHPGLPPAQIKKMTAAYMDKVLGVAPNEKVNLDVILEKSNTRNQLTTKLEEAQQQHDVYRKAVANLNSINQSINLLFQDKPKPSFVTDMVSSYNNVDSREENYAKFENRLVNTISDLPDSDLTKIAALWREYEALQANTFEKNYRMVATGDDLTFNISFTPTSGQEGANLSTLQIAPIQVPVAGGFKVNASIGVAFGQFFKPPQAYFVRDSVIRSDDKDSFFPVISSFFHFYSQSKGNVSFGGCFGIGLPITGDEAGQSASFFLGPSLIIGRGERLVLNAGLMGSRVERLAQGYHVGDKYISEANVVPTKDVYETGFFVGLSFNVLSNNNH